MKTTDPDCASVLAAMLAQIYERDRETYEAEAAKRGLDIHGLAASAICGALLERKAT